MSNIIKKNTESSNFSIANIDIKSLIDFDIWDNRKVYTQSRLNKFNAHLLEFLTVDKSIEIDNLKSEDFSDLFESVVKRYVQTKSNNKQKLFISILTNYIKCPYPNIDRAEIFMDLISILDETAIWILDKHLTCAQEYDMIQNGSFNTEEKERKSTLIKELRESNFYGLSNDQFLYYKQTLYSKGLLIDSGIGAIGVPPFKTMNITQFGKDFIFFIKSS
jgi:hypothetical protein